MEFCCLFSITVKTGRRRPAVKPIIVTQPNPIVKPVVVKPNINNISSPNRVVEASNEVKEEKPGEIYKLNNVVDMSDKNRPTEVNREDNFPRPQPIEFHIPNLAIQSEMNRPASDNSRPFHVILVNHEDKPIDLNKVPLTNNENRPADLVLSLNKPAEVNKPNSVAEIAPEIKPSDLNNAIKPAEEDTPDSDVQAETTATNQPSNITEATSENKPAEANAADVALGSSESKPVELNNENKPIELNNESKPMEANKTDDATQTANEQNLSVVLDNVSGISNTTNETKSTELSSENATQTTSENKTLEIADLNKPENVTESTNQTSPAALSAENQPVEEKKVDAEANSESKTAEPIASDSAVQASVELNKAAEASGDGPPAESASDKKPEDSNDVTKPAEEKKPEDAGKGSGEDKPADAANKENADANKPDGADETKSEDKATDASKDGKLFSIQIQFLKRIV